MICRKGTYLKVKVEMTCSILIFSKSNNDYNFLLDKKILPRYFCQRNNYVFISRKNFFSVPKILERVQEFFKSSIFDPASKLQLDYEFLSQTSRYKSRFLAYSVFFLSFFSIFFNISGNTVDEVRIFLRFRQNGVQKTIYI